jgi:tetratricopeptide (TPR) repeat protein
LENGTQDPVAEARRNLFLPLRNRTLARAADALAENHPDIAESLLRMFLEKKPTDADALNLMAEIARRAKRFEDAETLLVQCVERSPRNQGFRYNYSVVLRHMHKYERALAQIDELLHLVPGNPLFRDQKGTILSRWGKHAEALVCRRELIEEFPFWPEGWLHYGSALRDVGLQAECLAAYHRALELDPALTSIYAILAALKVYRFTAAEIEQMEKQLKEPGLTPDARADVHHALGKAYSDTENYAKSFENYARGNALRRVSVGFDPERLATHRRAFEKSFREEFFRERAGWGCQTRAPIFIVGLPRSGSTLIEKILSSHSAIEVLGELGDLDTALVRPLSEFRDEVRLQEFANGNAVEKGSLVFAYLRLLGRFTNKHFCAIGEEYLRLTAARRTSGRPFFIDKTLRNFFYVGLVQLMLPNAKIIDARRHPLDCGWSCFKSQFQGFHFSLRLGDIGNDYVNYVRLMAHFDRVLPGRVHRVSHENLVADSEAELRGLFNYLELPFEERCLRFYENERPVYTQSSEQVRKPLNRSGMGQWVPYEPWLGPLKNALGPILEDYPRVPE